MSFAQENANCLTTFFHSVIVMMVIPLHDDCYFSDVDVDFYVLSHSLPTGGRFGIFWNN